ncbi:putative protein serine/threonine kinase [Entophlyctis luteolus]|nr:putative protein serine/threonine kinase [Entophlyctis luteolus]
MENYQRLELLGRGSYGAVYKGKQLSTNMPVAIKVIDFEESNDDIEDIRREISILAELACTNVTSYYGSYVDGSELCIIMEYCACGSCLDLIKKEPLGEEYIKIILRETLKGLLYVHSQNKIHRDIKCANLLLNENGVVKLADFGVSAQVSATITRKNTCCGTPFWMPPEADIWSLGITAIELATGLPPYADVHPMKVLFLIPKNDPPTLDPSLFSKEFQDFVASCLKLCSEERQTAEQLLSHPFIASAQSCQALADLLRTKTQRVSDVPLLPEWCNAQQNITNSESLVAPGGTGYSVDTKQSWNEDHRDVPQSVEIAVKPHSKIKVNFKVKDDVQYKKSLTRAFDASSPKWECCLFVLWTSCI